VRAPAGVAYRTVALLRSLEFARADAHLIAAAPHLLAALTRILAAMHDVLLIEEVEDFEPEIAQARAAIAKAEGG
jgi:hypothetical protein